MTIFIAFGHRKRVGKDTAARLLCTHLRLNRKNSNIQVRGYADKGKQLCHELYSWAGLQDAQYYEDHPEEREIILPYLGKSPRQIWIDFMSKAIRNNVYDGTWTQYLHRNAQCDVCIIKDMRFPIEANKIQEEGGYVYKITRDCVPQQDDGADDPLEDYDRWNGIIANNGTLNELNRHMVVLGDSLLGQLK